MKQIIRSLMVLFIGLLFITSNLSAQHLRSAKDTPKKQLIENTADTLFHFDGFYFSVNGADYPDFEMLFQDQDNLTPDPDNYYEDSEWHFYYKDLGGGDTLNWVEATAWFSPPGQADDWITMGPLTVPESGASFSWRAYHNPEYRNGYEVLISTAGLDPEDFTREAMYTLEDLYDVNSDNIDTNRLFQNPPETFQLPDSVSGQQVYIAIHHNADDMDVLHLSDFVLKSNPTSVAEQDQVVQHLTAYPNPANQQFYVDYHLTEAATITFQLLDLAGKRLRTHSETITHPGPHQFSVDVSGLAPGIYIYSLQTKHQKTTRKIVVQH